MIDPYSVLGVNRNASKDDIKKAYRKLAMKNHPDRGGDETKFKEIKEAYERITEPSKFQQPGGGGGPFGGNPGEFRWDNTPGGFSFRRGGSVEDIFEDFFGFHGSRGQRTKQVQMSLWIDLEDVYKGGERVISVRLDNETRALNIIIPQGVQDGAQVRYPELGPESTDLLIIFRIHPHARFKRLRGLDLAIEIEVDFWQLILGTELPFKHLDNSEIKIKVLPRTKPDGTLRLNKKGLQSDRHVGDLYVRLVPKMPDNISEEILKVLKQQTK